MRLRLPCTSAHLGIAGSKVEPSGVRCGSVADLMIGLFAMLPSLSLVGAIVLGSTAFLLRTRRRAMAILAVIFGVLLLPIAAIFGLTTCY